MAFKLNDSVVVKAGVQDPDLKICIEGWQGRISEIEEEIVCIEWDSVTLKAMEEAVIIDCEQEGLRWEKMYLSVSDLERVKPRDTPADVEAAIDEINQNYAWVHLGEEGVRIQKVLAGIDPDDICLMLEAWQKYLARKLKFPIKAEIVELMQRGRLKVGDKVTIVDIHEWADELRGLFAEVTHRKAKYQFPLADLEALDQKSSNYQPIKDYVIWYANH